jgi:hypothetical protein
VTTPAGLSANNRVLIQWNPSPGAVAYDLLQSTASTLPTGQSAIGVAVGLTQTGFTDTTIGAYFNYVVRYGGQLQWAFARYDFTVDGGATVTPSVSDVIPINAIIVEAVINTTVAVTAAGAATVSIGTTAGSSAASILAATGKASFVVATPVAPTATFAAPVKMTAAGQINFTVATGPLTAGAIEVFVLYVVPSA